MRTAALAVDGKNMSRAVATAISTERFFIPLVLRKSTPLSVQNSNFAHYKRDLFTRFSDLLARARR